MRTKRIAIALLAVGAWLVPASRAQAAPAPAWKLVGSSLPTNFIPGSTGAPGRGPMLSLVATNVGRQATSGPITVTATAPAGLTPTLATSFTNDPSAGNLTCSIAGQTATCTTSESQKPGRWILVKVVVDVAPSATSDAFSTSIGGGGGGTRTTAVPVTIDSAIASFGLVEGGGAPSLTLSGEDGSAFTQAGAHPEQMTIDLNLPSFDQGSFLTGAGHLRDVITDLPRGLVVNPKATPELCTEAELATGSEPGHGCPAGSQLGLITVMTNIAGPQPVIAGLFNMVPSPGHAAELGFSALGLDIFVHIRGGVRSDGDYGLTAEASDALAKPGNPALSASAQLWGEPTSSVFDEIRSNDCINGGSCPVVVEEPLPPLLTMPSECSADPLITTLRASSWEEPDVFDEAQAPSTDLDGNPVGVNGCSVLKFDPTLSVQTESGQAESPTGAHFVLKVPQNQDPDGLATSNLKDVTVTLPAGLAVNPSSAGGLDACSSSQIGLVQTNHAPPHQIRFTKEPDQCPDSSKVGSVEVTTPLLDHTLPGALHVAKPFDNPFNSLLAVYVVVDDPKTGVVAKLAGKVTADPDTGQLTTTFSEGPELPFEEFDVRLFGGSRAALRTPADCGSFTTSSVMTPWSGTPPVSDTDSFSVAQGANGKPCTTSEGQRPNSPGFEAGTRDPIAGAFSPFIGRLTREDGAQQLKGLDLTLPAGLSGKIAGADTCSEAAIATAKAKSGNAELASPSCPAGSQLGEVTVGAGAGPTPYFTKGKVYLAGPYKGAPVSFAVITPAVAGPYDLGNVVVRAAAYVDRNSAVISVKSDPFPRILEGIPLAVRDIRVNMDRPEFTLNPTSCEQKQITGQAISVLEQIAPLAARFQVGACRALDFAPQMFLRLRGGTTRGAHPRLRVIGMTSPGEANLARASVALPRSEFLDQAHIRTVCTRVQFAAKQCPQGAIYGHIKAISPLLDEVLEGPVYLRSSSNELPDLVAALKGPPSRPIEVDVVGRIDSIRGGIRTTVETVPDVPVSKFILSMQGGKKGLLVNSRNLCASTNRATVKLDAQNGMAHDFRPKLKADCGKGKGKSKRRR